MTVGIKFEMSCEVPSKLIELLFRNATYLSALRGLVCSILD